MVNGYQPPPVAPPNFDIYSCLLEKTEEDTFCLHKLFWPDGEPEDGYPDFKEREPRGNADFKGPVIDYGDKTGTKLKPSDILPEDDTGFDCPELQKTEPDKLLAGEAANVKEIAKTLGLEEKCIQAASQHLDIDLNDQTWLTTLLGKSKDRSTMDTYMDSKGCGDFFTSLQNTFSAMTRLRCQWNKIKNQSTTRSVITTNININIDEPSDRAKELINQITLSYQDQINEYRKTKLSNEERIAMLDKYGKKKSKEYIQVIDEAYYIGERSLQAAMRFWQEENPLRAIMKDSKIQIKTKTGTTITIMNDIEADTDSSIIEDISRIASEAAIQNIQKEIGIGSLPDNCREFIQQTTDDLVEEQAEQIVEVINGNSVEVVDRTEIIINIYGSMLGSSIIIATDAEVDVKIYTCIASAIKLSEQVTSHIVAGVKVERTYIYKSEGITDLWAKIIDGATERHIVDDISDTVFWIAVVVIIAIFAYFYLNS
jgi:hypothetical protein